MQRATMTVKRISLMKSERINGKLTYNEIYGGIRKQARLSHTAEAPAPRHSRGPQNRRKMRKEILWKQLFTHQKPGSKIRRPWEKTGLPVYDSQRGSEKGGEIIYLGWLGGRAKGYRKAASF